MHSTGQLEIPLQYNHLVQAAVYNGIDPKLAAFLHEEGYQSGSRNFKLFAFSRLLGRFRIVKEKNTIIFSDSLTLVVSSPVEHFCQSIANGMLTKGTVRFGSSNLEVGQMVVQHHSVEGDRVVLRTLSPVVVYSTLLRPDGRKYTCYFQPGDPDYNSLVENNLRKKYQAFYGKEAPQGVAKIQRLGRGEMRLLNYKGTVIKGYTGKVVLTGPGELLQMAVDAGIGSKNSQGFGCVELA
nr:CRISPR-associated endoribonuclease Cas6 [Phosphitispora fastidiosa]